eukprot:3060880-Rhodomonas_salina.2
MFGPPPPIEICLPVAQEPKSAVPEKRVSERESEAALRSASAERLAGGRASVPLTHTHRDRGH